MAAGAALSFETAGKSRPPQDEAVPLQCKKTGGAMRRPFSLSGLIRLERQFITSVLMRFGTSPTGTTALIFMLAVSIAVTDRSPELEM
ncbi:MAG: hypothetical protein QOI40_292 [Alphaproteobacteria bacterium]|jgi:hypothetical protein|nr:hypothetical protein [Alphaproteobacteria bacterium]